MKKLLIFIAAILLVGCTEKKENAEIQPVIEPSATSATDSPAVTDSPAATAERVVSWNGLNVTDEGIQVIWGGEVVQIIKDTDIYAISGEITDQDHHPENSLVRKDFNSDGYKDLYVPYIGSEQKGVYYLFDPDRARYLKWNAVNELEGKIVPYHLRDVFDTLCEPPDFIQICDDRYVYFSADGLRIKKLGYKTTYTGVDGLYYTDTYFSAAENGEQLIRRTVSNGETIFKEIFVHPIQCYFTANHEELKIILKNGDYDQPVQTFSGDYLEDSGGHCTPPKYFVKFQDVNGDGYDDIYVTGGENAGKSFIFDPITFRFDENEV